MLTASSLLPALGAAVLVGGIATAWLWVIRRPQAERQEGLKLLSAMRWREFSRMVVDGLRSRGFEPEAAEDAAERGQDSVLHLKRDGREWLLACKQGVAYKITPTVVSDMADAIRFHGASGGVVAALGTADSEARKAANGQIELLEGDTLWPLVRAQLAPSVLDELWTKSRQDAMRQSAIAWSGAIVLGLAVALLVPGGGDAEPATTATTPIVTTAPKPARAQPTTPALTPPPASEEEQRNEVIRMVSTLPGIERAMWTTRSTLMIYLIDENADPVSGICEVVERYEALRTSRLHLQPPKGATRPARFLQCRTF